MGNELAMGREWDERREVDWHLTENAHHAAFRDYITELNRLYCEAPAVWSLDHSYDGFQWVENISDNPCVFGYSRTDGNQRITALFNFSDVAAAITPQWSGDPELLLNTDWKIYGGQSEKADGLPHQLPGYCGILIK